jgi:glycosyltransferase involved in cell wall biosynthesis
MTPGDACPAPPALTERRPPVAVDAVDIILPTHRRPHTIAYSIAAVLRQTHPHFTLHVVGDGCDEATEATVRAAGDARVRFHRFAKGRGFGYAHRNRVLRDGSAPFVAYANDDDLWFPDHLERGLAELARRQLDLVAFRSVHVQVPDLLDPHFFAFDWQARRASPFLRNWFMGAGTLVHRRSVFARAGYWNDRLFRFGDREFFNRVRGAGVPNAYVDLVTVLRFYAQHWDDHYPHVGAAPQQRYLARLAEPGWREQVRGAAAPGRRGLAIRRRQLADFARFALRSGPKFVRFWYERSTYAADTQPPQNGRAVERGA